MRYQYHKDGSPAPHGYVFVFGSNQSGIHGEGAAKAAVEHYGANFGQAWGLQGRAFAIPTVKHQIAGPLPLEEIYKYIQKFKIVAEALPNTLFWMTRIGCVLAGYNDKLIAPMFKDFPDNVNFPENWMRYLESPQELDALEAAQRLEAATHKIDWSKWPTPSYAPHIQTRSESTGIKIHANLQDACALAESDTTIWKISYGSASGDRVRFVREQSGNFVQQQIDFD